MELPDIETVAWLPRASDGDRATGLHDHRNPGLAGHAHLPGQTRTFVVAFAILTAACPENRRLSHSRSP